MKTKIALLLSLFLLITTLYAQPGNWLLAGNLLFGNEKFGSTNAIPLNFYTNNTQRMQLDVTGNLGIGGVPNNRLDVFAGDIDVNAPRRSYMINDKSILWHKGNVTNLFVGVGAGQNHAFNVNTHNTFIGNNAAFSSNGSVNTNTYNVVVGSQAGYNYSGSTGVIIGAEAGYNILGVDNATFIGYRAGYTYNGILGSTGNTFVGIESGYSTLGSYNDNTFVGGYSGRDNTTGDNNSFFGLASGKFSITGSRNCFFGNVAGQNNGAHNNNYYFGFNCGTTSTGDDNIFVGNSAGASGVGDKNVVIGNNGMGTAISSSENVAIGFQTGLNGNTNNFNTILGSQSAINLANSNLNTLVGYKAAFNQTSGSENTYVGESTGNNVQSGTNNTFIGAKTDATNITPMLNNAAAIGANAQVTNDNHMILGDNNVNVGIGLSGDPTGPGNKLEINTAATSPIPGTSGLRFTDLNSTSTAGVNPGTGVLSVDNFGDIIYVQGGGVFNADNGLSTNGPSSGFVHLGHNAIGGTGGQLLNDREIPMNNFDIHLTNTPINTQFKNNVYIGYPNTTPAITSGRLNVYQNTGVPVVVSNTAIIGINEDILVFSPAISPNVGITGIAKGVNASPSENIGGTFSGLNNSNWNTGIMSEGIGGSTAYGIKTYAYSGASNIALYANVLGSNPNDYAGFFQGDVFINGTGIGSTSGIFCTSDQMFKTNIDSITNAKNFISQLKPRTFYMDTTNIYGLRFSNKKQYGFIAQDVITILPELVQDVTKPAEYDSTGAIKHNAVTYKTLNYDAFIALLMRGMQEQQKTIDSLKTKTTKQDSINNVVQAQIAALTSSISSCCSNTSVRTTKPEELNQLNIDLNDKDAIVLNQNTPNPFAEQTTITYNVPEKYGYAQIIFSTIDGRILKTVDITKKGRGQINVYASDLSSGMYTYSLNVDGKIFETKKMIKSE